MTDGAPEFVRVTALQYAEFRDHRSGVVFTPTMVKNEDGKPVMRAQAVVPVDIARQFFVGHRAFLVETYSPAQVRPFAPATDRPAVGAPDVPAANPDVPAPDAPASRRRARVPRPDPQPTGD